MLTLDLHRIKCHETESLIPKYMYVILHANEKKTNFKMFMEFICKMHSPLMNASAKLQNKIRNRLNTSFPFE